MTTTAFRPWRLELGSSCAAEVFRYLIHCFRLRGGRVFDPMTDTWTLHGARFSNRALQAMAGRMAEGHWYRFRRVMPGDVVCIEEVRRDRP